MIYLDPKLLRVSKKVCKQLINQPIRAQLEVIRGTEYRTEREEVKYQELYLPLDDYSGDGYEAVENNMDDDMIFD